MCLWIRSQDKTKLLKINNVHIREYNGYFCITTDIDNQEITLGRYEFHSSKRALEILDEIQKLLTPKMIIKNEGRDCVALDGTIYRTNIVSNINSDIQQLSTYVYEMPKE